jgi:hypothetical protein
MQHDLKNFEGKLLSSFFGLTSTQMQPMTYKELSCGFILE